MNRSALLAALNGNQEEAQQPLREAMLDELRAIYETYRQPCPFRPGDLVTPRRGRAVRAAGEPRIVLEIFDPPRRRHGEHGAHTEAGRVDMRVACWISVDGGAYAAFAAESWQYERYDGEGGEP